MGSCMFLALYSDLRFSLSASVPTGFVSPFHPASAANSARPSGSDPNARAFSPNDLSVTATATQSSTATVVALAWAARAVIAIGTATTVRPAINAGAKKEVEL